MYIRPKLPEEPKKPEKTDKTTVVAKFVCGTSDRAHYFSGWNEDEDEDEEFEEKQINPKSRHRIRMIDVLEKLPNNVSVEDLYVTASFSDDYLNLEVCYDKKVSLYDEQMKDYEEKMKKWKIQKECYDRDIAEYERDLKKELASIQKHEQGR